MFSDLLGNAVKFVAPGNVPQVLVRAEPRGEFVRLWFEDNGIGIPSELHDRIFEMFQRVSKASEGTGSWAITPCVNRNPGGIAATRAQGHWAWAFLTICNLLLL